AGGNAGCRAGGGVGCGVGIGFGWSACSGRVVDARSGVRIGIRAGFGFRARIRFRPGIVARRFGTGRCNTDTGRTGAGTHRLGSRIGIGAVERIAHACRRQPRRLVRTVRRERTGRTLTGRPYRRAGLYPAPRDDTRTSPSFITGISAPPAAYPLCH
ncbi:hypothetical protein, partial [Burkholderia sp. Tr-20390]|uniref:hypothetical protein n=1 Tax=Burkholderia sp. Tr-20390 TaxID=2703904 RepID=UPI00197FCD02